MEPIESNKSLESRLILWESTLEIPAEYARGDPGPQTVPFAVEWCHFGAGIL